MRAYAIEVAMLAIMLFAAAPLLAMIATLALK